MSTAPENGARAAGLVGLIGYPVEHSLSPTMHNAAFAECSLDYHYLLLPAMPEEFTAMVQSCLERGFTGWNVTVPHKERMRSLLDEANAEVEATGACNTVRVEHGRLIGFNTDIHGFMKGLEEAGGIPSGSKVVLLGAGGAARAVAWSLGHAGHEVLILSRNAEQAASVAYVLKTAARLSIAHGILNAPTLAEALRLASMVVNCTPAGMWPHIEQSPLPQGMCLPSHLLVYDLVYRPRPTRLLREAAEAGCRTQDGLTMLVYQGAAAFELWTGRPAPVETMMAACLD